MTAGARSKNLDEIAKTIERLEKKYKVDIRYNVDKITKR